MQPIVIILIIIAFASVAVLAYRQDRKRRRMLRAWANGKHLTMSGERRRGWGDEYPAFKLFTRGRSRHTTVHLEGEVGSHRLRCLDYRYTTGSGKNRQTHRYGVILLDTGTPVTPLQIRREHVFDRVGVFSGHDDIDFESAEFSRRFGRAASITGQEAPTAWLLDTRQAQALFGEPRVGIATMIDWVADWVQRGGPSLGKPTHFSTRDGKY